MKLSRGIITSTNESGIIAKWGYAASFMGGKYQLMSNGGKYFFLIGKTHEGKIWREKEENKEKKKREIQVKKIK
jgi:hypothetical protein